MQSTAAPEPDEPTIRVGRVSLPMIMNPMKPMDAVAALYGGRDPEVTEALIQSLSHAVFGAHGITSAGIGRRLLARLSYRIIERTTTRTVSGDETTYRCPIIERSAHPYAMGMLRPSRRDIEGLVEGGDPMNGPYMMIMPEIRLAGDRWDRLYFNSVQGRDVQLRFIWETLATHAEATRRLQAGNGVKIKALAAGTGLSAVLVYDRLVRDGHDPKSLTLAITDREASNTAKTRRLLSQLATTRDHLADTPLTGRLAVFSEDAFAAGADPSGGYDIATAVGIFEYLSGQTCDTTERRQGQPEAADAPAALPLAARLAAITADDASIIVNTYRPHHSIRLLEVFGKKFDYRTRTDMARLLGAASFKPDRLWGSGIIYDVEVYKKSLT